MSRLQITMADLVSSPLWFHKRHLMQTATGYGRSLKTEYKIKHNNKLYRLYNCCYSNTGTLYIKTKTGDITVEVD